MRLLSISDVIGLAWLRSHWLGLEAHGLGLQNHRPKPDSLAYGLAWPGFGLSPGL